jgi:hypothetical protein
VLLLSTSAKAADFTADRIDDLLVGVPQETFPGVWYAGAVQVIAGSSSGLTSAGDAFVHQDTGGVTGSNADASGIGDFFGTAVGAGDVDGDGVDDVIVGGPAESVRGARCGAVWRLALSPTRSGMAVTASQELTQATTGVTDTCEDGDAFGEAVAVADFDGDGYDDVVVGIPGEDVGAVVDAGAVQFLPGSPSGLTATGNLYYDQGVTSVIGNAEADDAFGAVLGAGDFDADGYVDLAIGVPGEDWTGTDEGSVHVMYSNAYGPNVTRPDDEIWTAGVSSIAGTLGDGNACGSALAVGDFDGDGYEDLAVGCPYDASPGASDAGSVLVLYGSAAGLDRSESWVQPGAGGSAPESGDTFGRALTSGDYDGDGYDDLAVAAPGESSGPFYYNGVVNLLWGAPGGLVDVDAGRLAQDEGALVPGSPRDYDGFGTALATGDYDDDGIDDLVVGALHDDDAPQPGAGTITVFYGGAGGPSGGSAAMFHQDTAGIDDAAEGSEFFGASLR